MAIGKKSSKKATKKKGLGIKIPRNAMNAGRKAFQDDPNGGENLELDAGTYAGAIVDARGIDTKNGPQIVFDVKVGGDNVDEKDHGGKVGIFQSLHEERIVHLFRLLSKLGYDVDELDEDTLAEIIEDLKSTKPCVKIRVGGNGFANIKGLLEDMDYDELFGDSAEEDDDEDEDDEDDEDDEEEGDELDDLDRKGLKKFIKSEELDIRVKQSMSDDDIRNAIREEMDEEEED